MTHGHGPCHLVSYLCRFYLSWIDFERGEELLRVTLILSLKVVLR